MSSASDAISIEHPDDSEIDARIRSIFSRIDGLQDVEVSTHDGVVHLAGATSSLSLEQQATELAGRVNGVVHVTNGLDQPHGLGALGASVAASLRRILRTALGVIPRIIAAGLVIVPFVGLWMLLGRWRRPLRILGASTLSGGILRGALRVLVLISAMLIAFETLGILGLVGGVLGTLGVFGLAAGFLFRDWVANYLPGVLLGLRPPFKAGDLVRIGAHEGRVVRITTRSIVLLTVDGEELRIPSVWSMRESVTNLSRHRERRLRFKLPVSPSADLRLAQALGQQALLTVHGVLADPPPFMRAVTIDGDEIGVEYFAWVDQERVNYRTAESTAKRVVYEALRAGGVQIAQQVIVVRDDKEDSRPLLVEEEAVEERDSEFLEQAFGSARAEHVERDLLEEGAKAPGVRQSA